MRSSRRVASTSAAIVLAAAASLAVADEPHEIGVVHDLDVSEFPSSDETASSARIAFDGEGGLVVLNVTHTTHEDVAVSWKRIDADGAVTPAVRIPLPASAIAQRIAFI